MQATEDPIFTLNFHFGALNHLVNDVDPDKYSYIVLLSDFAEYFFADPDAWKTLNLSVKCRLPNSDCEMSVIDSDRKVCQMFTAYKDVHMIDLYCEEVLDKTLNLIDIDMTVSKDENIRLISETKKDKKKFVKVNS